LSAVLEILESVFGDVFRSLCDEFGHESGEDGLHFFVEVLFGCFWGLARRIFHFLFGIIKLRLKRSSAIVTVPVSNGLHSTESFVAVDVAGIGLTAVADQDDVSRFCVAAAVACPVQNLGICGLVHEIFGLDCVPCTLADEVGNFGAAVGAPR
jgi:hypothetical protein